VRCTPRHGSQDLTTFNDLQKSGLKLVTNCDLRDLQWLQACLLVRDGGLGIRRAAPLTLSAFLASAASTLDLQDEILANAVVPEDARVADYEAEWSSLHSTPLPSRQYGTHQPPSHQAVAGASHTACRHTADKTVVLSSFSNRYDQARLAAVSMPHSSVGDMAI